MKVDRLIRVMCWRIALSVWLTRIYDRLEQVFSGPANLGAAGEREAERFLQGNYTPLGSDVAVSLT